MRRFALLLSICLVLAVTAAALAANPKRGGFYTGTKAGTVSKKLTLKVSQDRKRAVANLYCADQHTGKIKNVEISKGSFSGKQKVGSTLVWSVKGSFSSASKASAKVNLNSVCDGVGFKVTLTLAP